MNKNQRIILVSGITKNNAIGKNGDLIVKSKTDLKRFKAFTTGNICVMGYNTYKSLPKFPLPNRINVVIGPLGDWMNEEPFMSNTAHAFTSPDAAIAFCRKPQFEGKDICIIGGGMLYRTMISIADYLYLTEFQIECDDADTFFPDIDPEKWEELNRCAAEVDADEVAMDYVIYKRKKNIKSNNTVKKYRKKPVEIEAVQYHIGKEVPAVDFLGGYNKTDISSNNYETDTAIFTEMWSDQSVRIQIKTLEGLMMVNDGDYIIKGIKGEFYPCKPDIFEATYECVE